jgi:hypothetical protein
MMSGRGGTDLKPLSVFVLLLFATVAVEGAAGTTTEPDLRVWQEFVDLLESQPFPAERIRPYQEALREPVLGFLEQMREEADWSEWSAEPEAFRVDERIHFVLPLTFSGQTATYCFSFLLEGGVWFFQHLEGITLRLDALGLLPVSEFPDLPEPMKAWMRSEIEVSREVWLYNTLAAEKGREAALDWFRDGAGYALAARSWVPFVRPERAFILYLCWEQSRLRGNALTLERLTEGEALVRLTPMYLMLYEKTGHLKQQIAFDDYRGLFEFRWKDRAASAGWRVAFRYDGADCFMDFKRAAVPNGSAPTSE